MVYQLMQKYIQLKYLGSQAQTRRFSLTAHVQLCSARLNNKNLSASSKSVLLRYPPDSAKHLKTTLATALTLAAERCFLLNWME